MLCKKKNQEGMILVMVVLITSAILAVGLGIFSSVFNQLRTASETRFSFNAFYAADRGMERTLYLDRVVGPLCPGVTIDGTPDENCYILSDFDVGNNACVTVRVSKDIQCSGAAGAGLTRVQSTGLYQCGSGELGVKRAFCLNYQPTSASGASFTESGGLVSGEAEGFYQNVSQGAPLHNWVEGSAVGGASGSYMEALPNIGTNQNTGYAANSPYLTYDIDFSTIGNYYVWIRMNGPDGGGDSLHAGIDSIESSASDRITGGIGSWSWTNSTMDGIPATIDIATTGVHELYLWMREDGNRIDQWLLTTDGGLVCPDGVNCL